MGFLDKFISKEAQEKIKATVKSAAEVAEEKLKEAAEFAEEKKKESSSSQSAFSPAQVAAKVETPQVAPVAPQVAKVEVPLKESALQKEATAPGDSTTTTNQSEGKEEKA